MEGHSVQGGQQPHHQARRLLLPQRCRPAVRAAHTTVMLTCYFIATKQPRTIVKCNVCKMTAAQEPSALLNETPSYQTPKRLSIVSTFGRHAATLDASEKQLS